MQGCSAERSALPHSCLTSHLPANLPTRQPSVLTSPSANLVYCHPQISMNAPVMVEVGTETDPLEIAYKELREKKIPFIIRWVLRRCACCARRAGRMCGCAVHTWCRLWAGCGAACCLLWLPPVPARLGWTACQLIRRPCTAGTADLQAVPPRPVIRGLEPGGAHHPRAVAGSSSRQQQQQQLASPPAAAAAAGARAMETWGCAPAQESVPPKMEHPG